MFARLRRWVDRDLSSRGSARGGDHFSLIVGIIVIGGGIWFAQRLEGWRAAAVLFLAAGPGLAWLSFVAWRMWRLARASVMKSDREYDHSIKHELPSEYATSESAKGAARARRKHKAP